MATLEWQYRQGEIAGEGQGGGVSRSQKKLRAAGITTDSTGFRIIQRVWDFDCKGPLRHGHKLNQNSHLDTGKAAPPLPFQFGAGVIANH
jgi:hypothetical protein